MREQLAKRIYEAGAYGNTTGASSGYMQIPWGDLFQQQRDYWLMKADAVLDELGWDNADCVVECFFCGAVVVDRPKHTQWHSGAPPGSPTWAEVFDEETLDRQGRWPPE